MWKTKRKTFEYIEDADVQTYWNQVVSEVCDFIDGLRDGQLINVYEKSTKENIYSFIIVWYREWEEQ